MNIMIGGKPPNPHFSLKFINQSCFKNIGGGFCSFTDLVLQFLMSESQLPIEPVYHLVLVNTYFVHRICNKY